MKLNELFNFRKEELKHGWRDRKAVIALGGGGARGLAHLGVMESIGEAGVQTCLLYTSPSPRDQRGSRMPSSA